MSRGGARAALRAAAACLGLHGCAAVWPPAASPDGGVFFDDFNEVDAADLARGGWSVRTQRGHPGVDGAGWGTAGIGLIDDPQQPGNRLLRLRATTDGTPAGTLQAQVCHARKYLAGTYAARVRFNDATFVGPDGDQVVQTFYTASPLRFPYDPQYSEIDWEYLAHGGWGEPVTRLYSVTWQTVRIDPWDAYNQIHVEPGSMGGWHTLLMQVDGGRVRLYIDGALKDEHGGRNYPVAPMSINFNLWFVAEGLLPRTTAQRGYEEQVDWVYHARNRVLSPAEVDAAVAALRRAGTARTDSVPPAEPPLPSPCDL